MNIPLPGIAPASCAPPTLRTRGNAVLLVFSTSILLFAAAGGVVAQNPSQPINLSTRMRVQTGENVGIGGFIIDGASPKRVLIRGIGPSLKGVGVTLPDPTLKLYRDGVELDTNNNWKTNDKTMQSQEAVIRETKVPPTNDLESAILITLNQGMYTAILGDRNDKTGVGLVEVYDLDPDRSKLVNISTRAFVETGSNIVIAGFVLRSDRTNNRIIVRGIGPSLDGIADTLKDPTLELRNSNGALLLANDDWRDNEDQAMELEERGFQPRNDYESGIVASLAPGSYTALLAGFKESTGVGLVEVYDLGAAPNPVVFPAERMQTGTWNTTEKQRVRFSAPPFGRTFTISVYKPVTINKSDIGSRAALQGETAPIPFSASAEDIEAALLAIPRYYAYGQFGNLELDEGSFDYFASVGATKREPIVTLESGGTAASGFTIEFGSLVGDPPRYNTWVAGMPKITIEIR